MKKSQFIKLYHLTPKQVRGFNKMVNKPLDSEEGQEQILEMLNLPEIKESDFNLLTEDMKNALESVAIKDCENLEDNVSESLQDISDEEEEDEDEESYTRTQQAADYYMLQVRNYFR